MSNNINTQILQIQQQLTATKNNFSERSISAKAGGFEKIFEESIKKVNSYEQQTEQLQSAIEKGESNIADAIVSMEKSKVAFKMLTEVRNKLVQTYHDIWNMSV